MKKIVCLDTHILIWGIQNSSSLGQEDMIQKAIDLLVWLQENDYLVVVPSIVLAELLMRVPTELHMEVNRILEKSFFIAPFDTLAASHFASIWQKKKEDGAISQLKEAKILTREAIKFDCQIVAIAIARNAEMIYSHDIGVQKFGEGLIQVQEIPFFPKQLSLF